MTQEKINIWDKPGCELPDGKLCVACCQNFTITEFDSPAGQLCRFAKPGKGCEIVCSARDPDLIKLRNERCGPYHCSHSDAITQEGLRLTAFHLGQVTREEYLQVLERK